MSSDDFHSAFPEVDKAIYKSGNVYHGYKTDKWAVMTGKKSFEKLHLYKTVDDYVTNKCFISVDVDSIGSWRDVEAIAYSWCLGERIR